MIFKGKNLISQIHTSIKDANNEFVQKSIDAIYKGSALVWRTVYNAVKSCFGSGTWRSDKPWLDGDTWNDN